MAVPKHLRFFTLFVDGENEVGKVTSVTPPKLTRKTDSYRGGGMMALFLKYGGTIDGTLLRFAGEYYTDAESDLYEIEMRGRVTEIDMGEAKQGEATSHTYAVKNTYYKLSVNDRPLWEIDLLNHIYRKDGKDIVPDRIRSALGLG